MNWNLKDIFKNKEEFENTKKELLENLDKIEALQGKLCDTSDNLYNCYKLDEKALEQFEKIYSYGMLKYHLDMSNGEGIKIFKEVEGIGTIFSTKTSYITPEITYADEAKIRKYLEEERFEGYKRDILDYIKENYNEIYPEYTEIYDKKNNKYWEVLSDEINSYCKANNIKYINYFYHKELIEKKKASVKNG